MIDPATLVAVGGKLLGGIFGRNAEKKAIARQNEYNKPLNVRKRAEEGGFNPLLFVAPGVGQQTATGGSNYMGSAIADAGLLIADDLARKGENKKISALEKQNEQLIEKLRNQTLRPKIGGIYAQRESVPSIRQSVGGANSGSSAVSSRSGGSSVPVSGGGLGFSPALSPLLDLDPIDPRRGVDNKDISTTSGVLVVDNPYLDRMYFPTIDGDEPLDILDIPSLAIGSFQLSYGKGKYLAYGGMFTSADRKRQASHAKSGQDYLKKRDALRKIPKPFQPNGPVWGP